MIKLSFLLLLIFRLPALAQTNAEVAALPLTPEQLKSDFQLLADVFDAYHPSAYRFVSRDSMQRSVSAVLARLNEPLSEEEFHIVVRHFVTQVHCGHTVAMPSESWYARQRTRANFFPFKPLVVGDALYIPAALATDSLAAGKEIVSVNGRNAADILNEMRAIHSRDGFSETFADHSIASLFETYYLFLYGSEPEYAIVYRNESGTVPVVLKTRADITRAGVAPSGRGLEAYRIDASSDWSELYINDEDSMAVLQIRSFGNGGYRKYYKKVFRELEKQQIPNLVIDLRDNGGGYFPSGNRLLRYLDDEPFTFRFSRPKGKPEKNEYLHMGMMSRMSRSLFGIFPDPVGDASVRNYEIRCKPKKKNHFDGRLYVLTNGGSFSLSGYVSARLQHRTDALMIGEETGGGEEGSNAVLFYTLTLPASGIRVNVPYYHLDHQLQGIASERGVMPDIVVKYSVEDLLNGTDQELRTVLSEVRKQNAAK